MIGKIVFILVLAILIVHGVSALSITISMNPSFNIGQPVSFNYTLSSNEPVSSQYIIGVSCPTAPIPLLQINNLSLQPGQSLTQTYTYISTLSDSIEPQTCNATILVIGSMNQTETRPFTLNTNPSFNFSMLVCKDINCSEPARIFVLGDTVYIRYHGETGLNVKSSLTSPDGTIQNIILPANMVIDQTGLYMLNVTASKQGYKTIVQSIDFGSIREEPSIPYTSLVVEKQQIATKSTENLIKYILIIAGGILVLVLIILIMLVNLVKRIKKRNK